MSEKRAGNLAMAILGARPPAEDGDSEEALEATDSPAEESSERMAMKAAAGEMRAALEQGNDDGIVAAFEAMFRAKMGRDTDEE